MLKMIVLDNIDGKWTHQNAPDTCRIMISAFLACFAVAEVVEVSAAGGVTDDEAGASTGATVAAAGAEGMAGAIWDP